MPSSRGSDPGIELIHVSCTAGEFLTAEPPEKPQHIFYNNLIKAPSIKHNKE